MPRAVKIDQVCEVCFKAPAVSLTHDPNPYPRDAGKWYFCCDDCLRGGYWISFDRIREMDWYSHMMSKGWVHMPSFMPRFAWAYKQVFRRDFSPDQTQKT